MSDTDLSRHVQSSRCGGVRHRCRSRNPSPILAGMQSPHEGPSPDDVQALRAAWDAWCATLAETGHRLLDGEIVQAADSRELAEALRATMRMAAMAAQQRIDFNDPDFPRFFRALDDRAPYAGPDAHITYLSAAVRGDATYRISGRHHDRQMNLGRLWSADLETDDEGRFEIIASAQEHAGNWVALDPAATRPDCGARPLPDGCGGADGPLLRVGPRRRAPDRDRDRTDRRRAARDAGTPDGGPARRPDRRRHAPDRTDGRVVAPAGRADPGGARTQRGRAARGPAARRAHLPAASRQPAQLRGLLLGPRRRRGAGDRVGAARCRVLELPGLRPVVGVARRAVPSDVDRPHLRVHRRGRSVPRRRRTS